MIDKSKFRNLKGRRIYLFWLDENTGEITDVTSRSDVVQVIRCKECKEYAEWGDSMICMRLGSYYGNTKPNDFCSRAERKDEYITLHHDDIHFIDEDAERAFYESLAERKEE